MRRTYIYKIETDDASALEELLDELEYIEYFECQNEEFNLEFGDVVYDKSSADILMKMQTGYAEDWYSSLYTNHYSDSEIVRRITSGRAKFLVKNGVPVEDD